MHALAQLAISHDELNGYFQLFLLAETPGTDWGSGHIGTLDQLMKQESGWERAPWHWAGR